MEVGKIKKVIPEGTRDYTIEECFKRNKIIEKIKNIFRLWGYREVSTPTIEYFDNFNSKTKTLKEEEMYKFFDNRGHILVLRNGCNKVKRFRDTNEAFLLFQYF